jgi:hypothetical protein
LEFKLSFFLSTNSMDSPTLLYGAGVGQRRLSDKEYDMESKRRNDKVSLASSKWWIGIGASFLYSPPLLSVSIVFLQHSFILDLSAATRSDGSTRFPALAKHLSHVVLTPGSLKVEPFQRFADADPKGGTLPSGQSILDKLQSDIAATADLGSGDFELYCKEHLVKKLADLGAVSVSLDDLCASKLLTAADYF